MIRHDKKRLALTMLVLFAMGACVTINIYFPAEKVESVAQEIVRDVRGKNEKTDPPPRENKQGMAWNRWLCALSPSAAWAQDVTGVSNPTIRALKEKMKARFGQTKPFFQKGILKESDDGYVAIADDGGLGLKEKRDLKALVEAENKDRRQLYEAVAEALGIDPGQINRVAEIFAKEWQKTQI